MKNQYNKYKLHISNASTKNSRVAHMTESSGSGVLPTVEINENSKLTGETAYDAFKELQIKEYSLFLLKDSKYGAGNVFGVDVLTEDIAGDPEEKTYALLGIYLRMRDKLSRFKNLLSDATETGGETIEDTLMDLSNYANMAILIQQEKWAKR